MHIAWVRSRYAERIHIPLQTRKHQENMSVKLIPSQTPLL